MHVDCTMDDRVLVKFEIAYDGKVETPQHKAGDVSWGPPAKHKEENLSDKPFEVLVVELKS